MHLVGSPAARCSSHKIRHLQVVIHPACSRALQACPLAPAAVRLPPKQGSGGSAAAPTPPRRDVGGGSIANDPSRSPSPTKQRASQRVGCDGGPCMLGGTFCSCGTSRSPVAGFYVAQSSQPGSALAKGALITLAAAAGYAGAARAADDSGGLDAAP